MFECALKIHRLFHKMAQGNRAIGSSLPGGLSLVQNQMLVELDADKQRTLRDLEGLLKLDQSSISRLASGLERDGFLKRIADPQDARRYQLSLTAAGRRIIAATDKMADQKLEELCSALTRPESSELLNYFRKLGDGLDEPRAIPRLEEHPMRSEQRRLARAVGLLSDSYMKSGLAVTHWHLMEEVCSNHQTLHVKALSERIGLAKNSVSTIVAQLQRKQLLKKVPNKQDARSVYVVPTVKGSELFKQLEKKAAQLIESALIKFSATEAQRFCDLLKRFVLAGDKVWVELIEGGKFCYARTAKDRAVARKFLVLSGVRVRDALFLPEVLFGQNQINVLFKLNDEIKAAFQFEQSKASMRLTCAGWRKSIEAHIVELVIRAAEFVNMGPLEIDYPPLAAFITEVQPTKLAV